MAAHILGHNCRCEYGHDMAQSQTKDQPMTSRYRNTRIKRIKHQDTHAMLYSTFLKCTFLVLTIVKHIMKCYLGFKYLAVHHIYIYVRVSSLFKVQPN